MIQVISCVCKHANACMPMQVGMHARAHTHTHTHTHIHTHWRWRCIRSLYHWSLVHFSPSLPQLIAWEEFSEFPCPKSLTLSCLILFFKILAQNKEAEIRHSKIESKYGVLNARWKLFTVLRMVEISFLCDPFPVRNLSFQHRNPLCNLNKACCYHLKAVCYTCQFIFHYCEFK